MIQVQCSVQASALGKSFSKDLSVATDNAAISEPQIPAAKTGSLTTRTDLDTGTLTMEALHGILTGDRLDVYWNGGKRVGMVVGVVAGASVPIDGGVGDALPAAATAVTAMVPHSEPFNTVGNDTAALLSHGDARCTIVLRSSAPADLHQIDIESPTDDDVWAASLGSPNPLAGATAATVLMSHADSSAPRVVRLIAPFN